MDNDNEFEIELGTEKKGFFTQKEVSTLIAKEKRKLKEELENRGRKLEELRAELEKKEKEKEEEPNNFNELLSKKDKELKEKEVEAYLFEQIAKNGLDVSVEKLITRESKEKALEQIETVKKLKSNLGYVSSDLQKKSNGMEGWSTAPKGVYKYG